MLSWLKLKRYTIIIMADRYTKNLSAIPFIYQHREGDYQARRLSTNCNLHKKWYIISIFQVYNSLYASIAQWNVTII